MASKKLIISILIVPISLLLVKGQNVLELTNQNNVSETYLYTGYNTAGEIRLKTYIKDEKKNDTLFTHDLDFWVSRQEYPKGTKFDFSQKYDWAGCTYQFIDRSKFKSDSPTDFGGFIQAADKIKKFKGTIEILDHTDSTLRLKFDLKLLDSNGEKLKQFYKGERTFNNYYTQRLTLTDSATQNYFTLDKTHLMINAFDKSNTLLWQTNPRDSLPLNDERYRYYRTKHPIITYFNFGKYGKDDVIEIGYDNSQFGYLEMKTGKFHFRGQD